MQPLRSISRLISLLLALAAFGVSLLPVSAQGSTYYVALNGSDSNPGTEARPFGSINHGVRALRPGDTLLVRGGLYAEELRNTIPSGESWQRPVTLKAYPGEEVVLMPGPGAQRVITIAHNRHYIIIDGLTLDGTHTRHETVKIAGHPDTSQPSPTHIRLRHNVIRNAGAAQSSNGEYKYFSAGVLTTGLANHVEYLYNTIHNNGVTDYDHGIYHTASYGLIEGNIVYHNMGSGIKIGWGQNAVDNVVRNNLIYDNNIAPGADGRKKQGRGIGVYAGSGTLVYNNVIWGHHHSGIDVTYGGNNARIYHNTVHNNAGWGIVVGFGSSGDTARNTIVRNNIVYQEHTHPAIANLRGINTVIENNLTFGRNPQITQGGGGGTATFAGNIENTDPQFANFSARDFTLLAGSPAIDAGASLTDVSMDFLGVPRPQNGLHDLGAFEFASSSQQPSPPAPPQPEPTPEPINEPTVELLVSAQGSQPGAVVDVALRLHQVTAMYGLQADCAVNPAVLAGVDALFSAETAFNEASRLLVDQGYNATTGRWLVAASRAQPSPAVAGDGTAFVLRYQVQNSGETPITCDIITVDSDGRTLPISVITAVFRADGSSDSGPIKPPEIIDDDPVELPTETPDDDPAPPPMETPEVIEDEQGTIAGSVRYQSRADSAGIRIQVLQDGAEVAQLTTDASGDYRFEALPLGAYSLRALGPQHLAQARALLLESAQPVELAALVLLAGDVDNNGVIDVMDAGLIGANFGLEGDLFPTADLNGDGLIDIRDLVLVGSNFGQAGQ
jgi:hypothetical protein